MPNLHQLPPELLLLIAAKLSPNDLASFAMVCRTTNAIVCTTKEDQVRSLSPEAQRIKKILDRAITEKCVPTDKDSQIISDYFKGSFLYPEADTKILAIPAIQGPAIVSPNIACLAIKEEFQDNLRYFITHAKKYDYYQFLHSHLRNDILIIAAIFRDTTNVRLLLNNSEFNMGHHMKGPKASLINANIRAQIIGSLGLTDIAQKNPSWVNTFTLYCAILANQPDNIISSLHQNFVIGLHQTSTSDGYYQLYSNMLRGLRSLSVTDYDLGKLIQSAETIADECRLFAKPQYPSFLDDNFSVPKSKYKDQPPSHADRFRL